MPVEAPAPVTCDWDWLDENYGPYLQDGGYDGSYIEAGSYLEEEVIEVSV